MDQLNLREALLQARAENVKQLLTDTSAQKLQQLKDEEELGRKLLSQRIDLLNERESQAEGSLARQWGLSTREDPILHLIVNSAVGAGVTSARIIGNLAQAPEAAQIQELYGRMNSEHIDALNRYLTGNTQEGDDTLLLQQLPGRYTQAAHVNPTGAEKTTENLSPIEILNRIQRLSERSETIKQMADFSKYKDNTRMNQYQDALLSNTDFTDARDRFDRAEGFIDSAKEIPSMVLEGGKELVKHPGLVGEVIAESSPFIGAGVVGGAGGLGLAVGSEGVRLSSSGFANKLKEGLLPTSQENQRAQLAAGAHVAANFIGDYYTAGTIRAVRGIREAAKTARTATAADLAKQTGKKVSEAEFKTLQKNAEKAVETTVMRSLGNVLTKVGGGNVAEGPTEFFQEYMEGYAEHQKTDITDAVVAGLLGAASGGVMTGGPTTLAESIKMSARGATKAVETVKAQTPTAKFESRVQAARDEALKTGDISKLTDPKGDSYSPKDAVHVVLERAKGGTLEEQQAAITEVEAILETVAERHGEIRQQLLDMGDPSVIKDTVSQFRKFYEDAKKESDTEGMNVYEKMINEFSAITNTTRNFREHRQLLNEFNKLKEQRAVAEGYIETARNVAYPKTVTESNIGQVVDNIFNATEATPELTSQVDEILVMAITNPNAIGASVLNKLANHKNLPALTAEQQQFLKEAIELNKKAVDLEQAVTAERVSGNVVEGGKGRGKEHFTGIEQHLKNFGDALRARDVRKAQNILRQIEYLTRNSQNKAEAIRQAVKDGASPDSPTYLVPDNKGNWLPQKEESKKTDTFKVEYSPKQLLRRMDMESSYLEAVHKFMTGREKEFSTSVPLEASKKAVESKTTPAAKKATPTAKKATQASKEKRKKELTKKKEGTPDQTITVNKGKDNKKAVTVKGEQPQYLSDAEKVELEALVQEVESTGPVQPSEAQATAEPKEAAPKADKPNTGTRESLKSHVLNTLKELKGITIEATLEAVNNAYENDNTFRNNLIKALFPRGSSRDSLIYARTNEDFRNEFNKQLTEVLTKYIHLNDLNNITEFNDLLDLVSSEIFPSVFQEIQQYQKPEEDSKSLKDIFMDLKDRTLRWTKMRKKDTVLHRERDLLEKIIRGEIDLANQAPKGTTFSRKSEDGKVIDERDITKYFGPFLAEFRKHVQSLPKAIDENSPISHYRDLLQGFYKEGPDGTVIIDDKAVIAMAAAVLQAAQDGIFYSKYLGEAEIKQLLNYKKEDFVSIPPQLYEHFRQFAGSKNNIIETVGRNVVEYLGLTNRDENTPDDYTRRLEASFGALAVQALVKGGMFEEKLSYDNALHLAVMPESRLEDELQKHDNIKQKNPISFKERAINNPQAPVPGTTGLHNVPSTYISLSEDFRKALEPYSLSSNNFFNKVFKATKENKLATLEPVGTAQVNLSKTNLRAPALLREAVVEMQKNAFQASKEGLMISDHLGKYSLVQALGGDQRSPEDIQATRRENVVSKDNDLHRQLDYFYENNTMENLGQPKYSILDIWRNGRIGYKSRDMDLQQSKFHRFFYTKEAYKSEIEFGSDKENLFKLVLSEALGLKVEGKTWEDGLSQFDEFFNNEDNQDFLEGLAEWAYKIDSNDSSPLDPEFVNEIVEFSRNGEGAQTLRALIELGKYKLAKDTEGKTSFITNIHHGIDGKTNGPAISMAIYVASNSPDRLKNLLEATGIYFNDSEVSNFTDYLRKGKIDHYQSLANNLIFNAKHAIEQKPILNYFMKGYFDENGKVNRKARNFGKQPFTTLFFGSGVTTALNNGVQDLLLDIYDEIEKINADLKDPTLPNRTEVQNQAKALYDALNDLSLIRGPTPTRANIHEVLMNLDLSRHVKALEEVFAETFSESLYKYIKNNFGGFMANTQRITNQQNYNYYLLKEVENFKINQELLKMVEEGIIPSEQFDKSQIILTDLNKEQRAELNKRIGDMQPIVPGPFSNNFPETDRNNFLPGTKSFETAEANPYIASPTVVTSEHSTRQGKTRNKVLYPVVRGIGLEAPGVSSIPLQAHSYDSLVMHAAILKNLDRFGVHDEIYTGLDDFLQMGQDINQAFVEHMVNYSPNIDGVLSSLHALDTLLYNTPGKNNYTKLFNKVHDLHGTNTPLHDLIPGYIPQVFAAERVRLNILLDITHVDQYPWHGATFEIGNSEFTKEFHKKIQDRLDNLKKMEDDLNKRIEKIQQEFKNRQDDSANDFTFKNILEMGKDEVEVNEAPFKDEDPMNDAPDSEMYSQEAEESEATPIQENIISSEEYIINVLTNIQNRSKLPKEIKDLYSVVLYALGKYFNNKDVEIDLQVLSREDAENYARSLGVTLHPHEDALTIKNSNGKDFKVIMVRENGKSPTPEEVAHEAVHVFTSHFLSVAPNLNKNLSEYKIYQNIQSTYEAVQKYLNDNGLGEQYVVQMKDIHEFVAYGLTNLKFQKEVLSNVVVEEKPSNIKSSTLVNAFQALVRNIANALFGPKVTEGQHTALNELLYNAARLGELSENQKYSRNSESARSHFAITDGINKLSNLDVLERLNGDHSPEHHEKLRNVAIELISPLEDILNDYSDALYDYAAADTADTWMMAVANGQAPFTSQAAAIFNLSQKEEFAIHKIEAAIRTAMESDEATARQATKAMQRLFNTAKSQLTPNDFADPSQYEFIFGLRKDNGNRSEHLARFAAMGIGSEEFAGKLSNITEQKSDKPIGFFKQLVALYESFMKAISSLAAKDKTSETADKRLVMLAHSMVSQDARYRKRLINQALGQTSVTSKLDEGVEGIVNSIVDKGAELTAKLAESKWIQGSKRKGVKTTGTIVSQVARGRADGVIDTFISFRDHVVDKEHGPIVSLIKENLGHALTGESIFQIGRVIQQRRQQVIDGTTAHVQSMWKDFDKISKDTKKAITNVVLRTGLHNLLNADNTNGLEVSNLIRDASERDRMRRRLRTQLKGPKDAYDILLKTTADYLIHKVSQRLPATNAYQIVDIANEMYNLNMSEADKQHDIGILKQMLTLAAIDAIPQAERELALNKITEEQTRTDGNGFQFIIQLAKFQEQEAVNSIFKDNERNMDHGYTPDILNPYKQVAVVPEAHVPHYKAMGYVALHTLPANPVTGAVEVSMVLHNVGTYQWKSGGIGITDRHSRGTAENMSDKEVAKFKDQAFKDLRQAIRNGRLSNKNNQIPSMIPVFNNAGEITGWKHEMSSKTKEGILERNNDFADILGISAGRTYDKVNSEKANKEIVDALIELQKNEFGLNPDRFIQLTNNDRYSDIWNKLPRNTRLHIEEQLRTNKLGELYIRKDMLETTFGYREAAIGNMMKEFFDDVFKNEKTGHTIFDAKMAALGNLPFMEKAAVLTIDRLYYQIGRAQGMSPEQAEQFTKRSFKDIYRIGRLWKTGVKSVKDAVIIKSGIVLLINDLSNMTMLKMQGVSLIDILKDRFIGWTEGVNYQRHYSELQGVITKLDIGYYNSPQAREILEERKTELEDLINRNPVKPLMDEGLHTSIVEEVKAEENPYGYKEWFNKKTEKYTSWINEDIKNVFNIATLGRGTIGYNLMYKGTQLSDFSSRYALYKHAKNNKKMNHEDAIQLARQMFINYDLPMQRHLQYLDDMGLMFYMKYYRRINAAFWSTWKESPYRLIHMITLQNLMDVSWPVTATGAWERVGRWPLRQGALELPQALKQIFTVNQFLKVF